jgi:hypothetical protein
MILAEAISKGGWVDWKSKSKPRVLVPKGYGAQLKKENHEIREVMRRAVAFRGQLKEHSPVPLFVLPEGKNADTGCISCGEETPGEQIRCPLCQAAAWIALGIVPLNSGEL